MNRAPLLCIAGGGTGGHVMPALALADAARAQWPSLTVCFIGAERGLEATLLPQRGEQVQLLTMHGVNGAGIVQRLRVLLWELPKAVMCIRRVWKKTERPDLLVGVGGYASISAVVAALISRIPVVLYEQNAMPGLVNRSLARFAAAIMLGFEAANNHLNQRIRRIVTGNIVRESIATIRWHQQAPVRLLVLGGSQGAKVLNQTVPLACQQLAREGRDFSVSHIVGANPDTLETVRQMYAQANINAEVMLFCDDMAGFYASGTLMVARAGAMTVSESACCGLPTLFVPLPHAADNHQHHNANTLAEIGAAVILDQHDLSPESLAQHIDKYLFDENILTRMSQAALAAAPYTARDNQLRVLAEFLPGLSIHLADNLADNHEVTS